jgi:small-conductance mechanosensitive channel
MIRHLFEFKGLLSLVLLSLFLQIQPAFAAGSKLVILGTGYESQQDTAVDKENAISDRIAGEPIETIVVTLSDEQVRHLIEALTRQPQQDAVVKPEEKTGGLAGLIKKIQNISNIIQWRIHFLKSGVGTDPENLPHLFQLLSKEENQGKPDPFKTIFSVSGLLTASLVILWLFRRYTAVYYRRIESATFADWKTKIGGLTLGALLDFISMFIFAIAALAIFFIFMKRSGPQSVLVATYLIAFLIVMGVQLISRFFLAPKVPALRYLPMDDETAKYLCRWIMAIAVVGSFGFLTCGIFRVAGISEANHLMMVAMVELVIVSMIITMILQKREQMKQALGKNLAETGLRALLVRIWHHLAIIALLLLWILSGFNLLLGGVRPGAPDTQTLLIIPLYFLLDWGLREVLRVVFGIAEKPENMQNASAAEASDNTDLSAIGETRAKAKSLADSEAAKKDTDSESLTTETEEPVIKKHMDVRRLNRIIGSGLRIALAAFVFFYLLELWGIDIHFGKAVTRAAFNILIAVLICYATWEVLSAAIQRRLDEEMPEADEEMEEGGAGGSRVGTLLLLLRKFILTVIVVMATLIILSSIGVNIGPLIAGAGVIGLAIGFGAQTLVKDIIAGLFFLMDDAFRVGDYIETGGTKGLVEHISLRSLRMRHPRGMVNTIPFGDIGVVTNMSRDYIITKLDFRVRHDTDVERVRKIIKKKVYEPILKNEELAPKLLDKIKSQGVREMDDSAMIMRVKYKTAPGEQFVIRKEVYRLMQKAFAEEGIEFAHRNVTVYIPPVTDETESGKGQDEGAETTGISDKKLIEKAGAAAAIAAAQADEDAKKPKGTVG